MLGTPIPLAESSEFRLVWIASTTNVLSVVAMIQRSDREKPEPVEIFKDAHAGDRTIETLTVATGGGILWGVSATIASGVKRGQAYATVDVGQFGIFFSLAKGYIYDGHALSDGEFIEPGPGGGEGNFRIIALTDPAAGNDYPTISVPSNAIWLVHSWTGILVCGAAAANRIPGNDYNLAGSTVVGGRASAKEFAIINETHDVCGGLLNGDTGITEADTNGPIIFNLPKIYLSETDGFAFVTQNLNALDDWGAGQAQVEEWLVI